MQKTTPAIDQFCTETMIGKVLVSNEIRILLQVLSVVAIMANLWIASRLAPIAQDLALINQRLTTVEKGTNTETTISNSIRLTVLEQQFARIETKLDNVLDNQTR